MFDTLLEDDPYFKILEERVVIQELKRVVVEIVKRRFPLLVNLAEQRVAHMREREILYEFIGLSATAPDEAKARWLFTPRAEFEIN